MYKKATETVHFGYKNDEVIDYIFVVDNSPSMEKAVDDDNTMLSGVQSVSKVMNVYSQTYELAKKLLKKNEDNTDLTYQNTATVIGFNGEIDDNYNSLDSSSYVIVENETDPEKIKTKLLNTKYKGVGCTNYSAGLARAYEKIKALQEDPDTAGHKQAIIFITDGNPTYNYNGQAISVNNTDANKQYVRAVNGLDWSALLRQDTTKANADGT